MLKPRVLILHADGTNRDHNAAQAFELADAEADIVHLNQLRAGEKQWNAYQLLAVPGGFSYADALGAGKLLALDLNTYFVEEVRHFIESGKPVIGICNGFQALVKSGLLSGNNRSGEPSHDTHVQCRWSFRMPLGDAEGAVADMPVDARTDRSDQSPIAHGEGRFMLNNPNDLAT